MSLPGQPGKSNKLMQEIEASTDLSLSGCMTIWHYISGRQRVLLGVSEPITTLILWWQLCCVTGLFGEIFHCDRNMDGTPHVFIYDT